MNNLILLGDSHLARLNRGKSPTAIQKMFPEVEIIDLSEGGANSKTGLEILKASKVSKGSTVLIHFGTNDAASWKQVPLSEFTDNLSEIINILKKQKCRIILITPPPVNTEKQIPPGRSNETLKTYADAVLSVAEKVDLEVINLFSQIENEMKQTDLHEPDGVHFNEEGYKFFKETLNNSVI